MSNVIEEVDFVAQGYSQVRKVATGKVCAIFAFKYTIEGLAEFKTAAAPRSLSAQILSTLRVLERTLCANASIFPCLTHTVSSRGAANWF